MVKLKSTASIASPDVPMNKQGPSESVRPIFLLSDSLGLSIMNSAVTPLYFEPQREQGTCWQPGVFYSYTQKGGTVHWQTFLQPQRSSSTTTLAESMFFCCCFRGREGLKDKKKKKICVPQSSRFGLGSRSSDCPLWRRRDGARRKSQV